MTRNTEDIEKAIEHIRQHIGETEVLRHWRNKDGDKVEETFEFIIVRERGEQQSDR